MASKKISTLLTVKIQFLKISTPMKTKKLPKVYTENRVY